MSTQAEKPMVSVEAIRESPLGADLTESQCLLLAEVTSIIGLDVGAPLLDEGHVDDRLYVVSSGSLEVLKPTGGGDAVTLQLLHRGDMAGILGFVDGVPHSAAIRALTQCELIVLDRNDLEQLIDKDPRLVYLVMRTVVRAAHRILGRMNAQFVEMSNYISKQHGRY
jgi:CRP-like cAMP-binding protein